MTTVQKPEDENKKPERPERRTRNRWTVMVYLAGDNNLAEEMIYALTSMNSVGSQPENYEVFALYDAGVGPAALRIRNTGSADERLDLVENADESREKADAEKEELARKLLDQAKERADALKTKLTAAEAQLNTLSATADDPERKLLQLTAEILKQQHAAARLEENLRESDHRMVRENNQAMENFRGARTSYKAVEALENLDPELGDSVPITLLDFIVDTIREHPAEHYMLVLSGHGSGAVGDFLSVNRQFASVGIPDLREVLKTVVEGFKDKKFVDKKDEQEKPYLEGKIDILGLDSCLMGMAEVAFEVRKEVNLLIGAEGFEPNTGWPYDEVLKVFQQLTEPEAVARKIVDKYIEFYGIAYTMSGVSTDLTALRLGETIEKFANALGGENGLSRLLTKSLGNPNTSPATRDNLVLAHWEAQGFKGEQHVDVYDFCERLQKRYPDPKHEIHDACQNVMKCFPELIVRANYCGPAFQHANGLSIFFPWANITDAAGTREMDHYKALEFAAATHWDEFVKCYHRHTQREARDGVGSPILGTLNRREWLFTGTPTAYEVPTEGHYGSKDQTEEAVAEEAIDASDVAMVAFLDASKMVLIDAEKFGFPGASKFGFPGSSKFGFPGASKFGFPGSSKFGFPGSSKFGFPGASKFGFPGSSKFAGAGSFEIFKIASMKNPPIIWFTKPKP